jgi:hypothetical protein
MLGVSFGTLLAVGVVSAELFGPCSAPRDPTLQVTPGAEAAPLTGLWRAVPGQGAREDTLRFWYFHGDGKGLYRYGTSGLNNTHSFDYEVVPGGVKLRFRKTGATHVVQARVEDTPAGPSLTLDPDPEDPGASYRLERGPVARGFGPAGDDTQQIDGRLWMDLQPFATGGVGFQMYQLNAAAIDGRGVGWFHRGDFDDWSTEALSYRLQGDALTLHFTARDERETVEVTLVVDGDDRVLTVQDDPRDFYKDHRYRDVGESFGALGRIDAVFATKVLRVIGAPAP